MFYWERVGFTKPHVSAAPRQVSYQRRALRTISDDSFWDLEKWLTEKLQAVRKTLPVII